MKPILKSAILVTAALPLSIAFGKSTLNFDVTSGVTQSIDVDGQTVQFRAFEHIPYVKKPVDRKFQQMNIYIPEAYFHDQTIGGLTAKTAPIFLPNNIGGYMPAEPATAAPSKQGPNAGKTSTVARALARGFVVAAPGARGRVTQNEAGLYTGKAPAAIVDLKAAVRYLRFNDKVMAGNAEKIVSNGTSAGGAMSALLGASGNAPEYAPYLKALGAAPARDDVFAVSAYCPITNLENADAAYEWQFKGVHDYKKMVFGNMIDFRMERKEVAGSLTAAEIDTSDALAKLFTTYLNSLGLKDKSGQSLTLDANGDGSYKNHVTAQLVASAQKALDQGTDLSAYPWIQIDNKTVQSIDFDAYNRAILRMKTPPAFDALDLSSGENDLFGTSTTKALHFTPFSQGAQADPAIVKLMNPMHFISSKSANHWRIRVGTNDRDTSLAISDILSLTLSHSGKKVDYALAWGVPHSGDYDLDDLFAWMAQVSQ